MKKEIDWSFWVKMVVTVLGGLFLLSFILGTRWRFSKKFSLQQDLKQKKSESKPKPTNPQQPLRVQIMSINTISLFFLLMTIQEYRMNEVLSPFGVDPEKIPASCQVQQLVSYWIIMILSLFIVGYNYLIVSNILEKATSSNVIGQKEKRTSDRYGIVTTSNTDSIIQKVHNYLSSLRLRNGMFMVEKYPSVLEFLFFVLIALFSIVFYVLLVLNNYNVLSSNIFRPCVSPLNNDRFYDPYATS
jgi:hypothetical protein